MTPDDTRTLEDLREQAADLDVSGRSTMTKPELEEAIAAAQADAGVTGGDGTVQAGDTVDLSAPPEPDVSDERYGQPSDPSDPDDGRPSLAQVAADAVANTNVRVIGGQEEA